MQVVLIKSPKALRGLLRVLFGIKKVEDNTEIKAVPIFDTARFLF